MPAASPFVPDPEFRSFADAVRDEYLLETELGRGGMGVVFRARDLMLDRAVALKVLPPHLGADPDVRTRFLREARTAAQLSHPHIVHIHRADERAGVAFFVMGLVEGENLAQRVRDRGPLSPTDAVRHLREAAWALAYAHARGVVHRDVKPENIMIERGSGRALVTDFGIARTERAAGLTSEGHIVGTAHYMSPEQIQGETVDGRTDLYALGVVGYFVLSGRLPFEGEQAGAVLVAHVTRPAPPLASVAPRVPRALAEVIDRCLAKDPAARPATGEDLAEALRRALEGAVAAKEPTVSGAHRVLSEDEAALIWRRAAQLQAEAAARLERETRRHKMLRGGSEDGAAAPSDDGDAASPPLTSAYRLQDVEAAAVEAGISQRFVALALSELPSNVPATAPDADSLKERAGRALFGQLQHSMSVSRVLRAPARDVLKAIGRTFQGHTFRLQLRDQIGPHPLDGGILAFKVPDMDMSGQLGYAWTYLRYGFYATELRSTIRRLDHDPGACEVTVMTDLRPGIGTNVGLYGGIAATFTGVGGAVGGVLGVKALALGAVLAGLPALVSAVAAGAVGLGLARWSYRYGLKKARAELEELLRALDVSFRSASIFEEDPPQLPPPAGGDDASFITSIS